MQGTRTRRRSMLRRAQGAAQRPRTVSLSRVMRADVVLLGDTAALMHRTVPRDVDFQRDDSSPTYCPVNGSGSGGVRSKWTIVLAATRPGSPRQEPWSATLPPSMRPDKVAR